MRQESRGLAQRLTLLVEDAVNSGASQDEIAAAAGVPATQLSRWKNGNREPKLASLRALADYFGVTVGWLVAGEYPKRPQEESEAAAKLRMVREILNAPPAGEGDIPLDASEALVEAAKRIAAEQDGEDEARRGGQG